MVEITLSPEKLALANAEACRRQQENEAKGLRGRNKAPDRGEKALKLHQLGCIGEVAVAEYLGLQEHLFSAQSAVRGSADLPGNIEVKTRSKHSYDLLVHTFLFRLPLPRGRRSHFRPRSRWNRRSCGLK